jgi:hypothetical protein
MKINSQNLMLNDEIKKLKSISKEDKKSIKKMRINLT